MPYPINRDLAGTPCAGATCLFDADILTRMTLRSAQSIGVLELGVPMCLEHAAVFRDGAALVSFDADLP